jgi:hypothetical protein
MISLDVLAPVVVGVAFIGLLVGVPLYLLARWRSSARQAGYPDLRTYLRAIPHTDAAKRAAVEMTLKGLICCILGVVFLPLLLIGVFPLYYGARKLAIVWLGLDILEDGGENAV